MSEIIKHTIADTVFILEPIQVGGKHLIHVYPENKEQADPSAVRVVIDFIASGLDQNTTTDPNIRQNKFSAIKASPLITKAEEDPVATNVYVSSEYLKDPNHLACGIVAYLEGLKTDERFIRAMATLRKYGKSQLNNKPIVAADVRETDAFTFPEIAYGDLKQAIHYLSPNTIPDIDNLTTNIANVVFNRLQYLKDCIDAGNNYEEALLKGWKNNLRTLLYETLVDGKTPTIQSQADVDDVQSHFADSLKVIASYHATYFKQHQSEANDYVQIIMTHIEQSVLPAPQTQQGRNRGG